MVKQGQHLLDTRDLSVLELQHLMERASYFEKHHLDGSSCLTGRFVANLFFEPSTRTRFSFEVAEKRLGLHVLNFSTETSSTTKGESLYDTIKTLSSMGVEAVVIRHREEQAIAELLEKDLSCTIINAGAGKWAHPTQALLDLYTIQQEFGEVAGLRIAMIGDLAHSRVVRSNIWSLKALGAEVVVSGPANMRDFEIEKHTKYVDIDEAISTSDVVMFLRVQLERHDQNLFSHANKYLEAYGCTEKRVEQMKSGAILMHPAPVNRGVEIADSVVEHPVSRIFQQMKNGVWVRMAVLERAFLNQGGN